MDIIPSADIIEQIHMTLIATAVIMTIATIIPLLITTAEVIQGLATPGYPQRTPAQDPLVAPLMALPGVILNLRAPLAIAPPDPTANHLIALQGHTVVRLIVHLIAQDIGNMETLKKRIEWSNTVAHNYELESWQQTIIENQIVIMDTLIDLQNDLRRVKKEYPLNGIG